MPIGIILAAFFGLCGIIKVAPHVKYQKPGAPKTVTMKAGESLVIHEDGSWTRVEAHDIPAPVEPNVPLPPYPNEKE